VAADAASSSPLAGLVSHRRRTATEAHLGRTYTDRTLKLLWYRSGGRCSYPKCDAELVDRTTEAMTGQIAHMVSESPDGPRGGLTPPGGDFNGYENLTLLCGIHHPIVDAPQSAISLETLMRWKADHERSVSERLAVGAPWECNVSQLYYVNIPRLAIVAAMSGVDLDFAPMNAARNLHDLGWELTRLLSLYERVVSRLNAKALPLEQHSPLRQEHVGATLSFTSNMRTGGLPGPTELDDFKLTGSLEHDPRLYLRRGPQTFYLTLDPRWVCTTTAFVNLRGSGGWARVAGLCALKSVSPDGTVAIATPYFLGIPKSAWDLM
jgi:hypothetical protein